MPKTGLCGHCALWGYGDIHTRHKSYLTRNVWSLILIGLKKVPTILFQGVFQLLKLIVLPSGQHTLELFHCTAHFCPQQLPGPYPHKKCVQHTPCEDIHRMHFLRSKIKLPFPHNECVQHTPCGMSTECIF